MGGVLASTRGKGNAVQERAIVLIGGESGRRRADWIESGFHQSGQTEVWDNWLQRSGGSWQHELPKQRRSVPGIRWWGHVAFRWRNRSAHLDQWEMSSGKFSAFELKAGQWYRVVTEFVDFDRIVHPVGECWRYHSRDFLPYEAGLTLNVEGEGLKSIRLQDYVGVQREIIDGFSEYVVEIETR